MFEKIPATFEEFVKEIFRGATKRPDHNRPPPSFLPTRYLGGTCSLMTAGAAIRQ